MFLSLRFLSGVNALSKVFCLERILARLAPRVLPTCVPYSALINGYESGAVSGVPRQGPSAVQTEIVENCREMLGGAAENPTEQGEPLHRL